MGFFFNGNRSVRPKPQRRRCAYPASTPVLNLNIASTDGTTPPVNINLLGLVITTSNIQVQLTAQTGDGQILGNLVYNIANILNPGGTLGVLSLLGDPGL